MDNNNEAPPVVDSYVTPLVISAVGILFTILILASFFFIFWWHYLRPHQSPHHDTTNSTISLIIKSSNGVPEEILNKIPVVTYPSSSSQENDDEASSSGTLVQSECSICLGQFKDEEKLRALPSCRHAFHVPCIDAWFQEHTNCPVCRSPIIACDNCESSSSALPTDSADGGAQQRVLHVIPIDNHHHQLMEDDDDDESACLSGFRQQRQQPHPRVLHRHSHSVSCHMMNNKKKPRSLGMRLKRSLSVDQSSLYVAVTIQRDQEEAAASTSSFSSSVFSTKGVMMSTRYKSKSLRHLDHVSRVLMRSFSQFRNSGRSSTGILPN